MEAAPLALLVALFGLLLWLGLYLIGRDPGDPGLLQSGLALIAGSLAVGMGAVSAYAPDLVLQGMMQRGMHLLLTVPAPLWVGALGALAAQDERANITDSRAWRYGLPLAAVLVLAVGFGSDLILAQRGVLQPGALYPVYGAAVLLPLAIALGLAWRSPAVARRSRERRLLLGVLIALIVFEGLLVIRAAVPPNLWLVLPIAGALLLLGLLTAMLDAADQGEALLPDIARAFDFSLFVVALFASQVVLVMLLGVGVTFAMLVMLLAVIASAIAFQIFSDRLARLVDRVALAVFPRMRTERAQLREAASAVPRVADALDLEGISEAEFTRLTRRALSHMGDLPRLAASPLTRLPLIQERLAARAARDDTLERAVELKAVLSESIGRLKPRSSGDFGATDEWRHYNALYFPYVAGLKPYSVRATNDHHDPAAVEALEWFRTAVPERTLHNWQTAAARLVAQDIRQQAARPVAGSQRFS